jgi:transcriptional regulator with XRE-family HTH domain
MSRAALAVLPSLRYWRIRLDLTRQQLAGRSTMSRSTVLRIETGYPAFLRTARLLATALDVQVDDLMGLPPEASWRRGRNSTSAAPTTIAKRATSRSPRRTYNGDLERSRQIVPSPTVRARDLAHQLRDFHNALTAFEHELEQRPNQTGHERTRPDVVAVALKHLQQAIDAIELVTQK